MQRTPKRQLELHFLNQCTVLSMQYAQLSFFIYIFYVVLSFYLSTVLLITSLASDFVS